jgi:hypothetical protein
VARGRTTYSFSGNLATAVMAAEKSRKSVVATACGDGGPAPDPAAAAAMAAAVAGGSTTTRGRGRRGAGLVLSSAAATLGLACASTTAGSPESASRWRRRKCRRASPTAAAISRLLLPGTSFCPATSPCAMAMKYGSCSTTLK